MRNVLARGERPAGPFSTARRPWPATRHQGARVRFAAHRGASRRYESSPASPDAPAGNHDRFSPNCFNGAPWIQVSESEAGTRSRVGGRALYAKPQRHRRRRARAEQWRRSCVCKARLSARSASRKRCALPGLRVWHRPVHAATVVSRGCARPGDWKVKALILVTLLRAPASKPRRRS